MLGLFSTKCPIEDPREKAWTELRMLWLAEEFGIDRMLDVEVLTPTPLHFPDRYGSSSEDAMTLMHRLCRHLGIDMFRINLHVQPDDAMPGAAGLYQESENGEAHIHIAQSQLPDPESLIATLAHELAHQLLLGERRLTEETAPDHEKMTDLLTVFYGLGIFGANVVVRDSASQSMGWEYWGIRRQGYLTARVYGYALALFAWVRGETRPKWARSLRPDPRRAFWAGLKYLNKTGDSAFDADTAGRVAAVPTIADLIDDLDTTSASGRIIALWDLCSRGEDARPATEAVLECLHDSELAVRAEAINTLVAIDADPSAAIPDLLKAVDDQKNEVRIAAIKALATYPQHPELIVDRLRIALGDGHLDVEIQAAGSLAAFGHHAQSATKQLLEPLRRDVARQSGRSYAHLATLLEIHPEAEVLIAEEFADADGDTLRELSDLLTRIRNGEDLDDD